MQFQQFIVSFERLLFPNEYQHLVQLNCTQPTMQLLAMTREFNQLYHTYPSLRELIMYQYQPCSEECQFAVDFEETISILEYGIQLFSILLPCELIYMIYLFKLEEGRYPSVQEILVLLGDRSQRSPLSPFSALSPFSPFSPLSPLQRILDNTMSSQVDEFWRNQSSGLSRTHFSSRVLDSSHSESCAICQEPMVKGESVITLPCTHTFHSKQDGCDGIEDWYTKMSTCPLCKHPLQ